MKRIPIFILAISFLIISSVIVSAHEDSIRLIQKAYHEGELDYQTALNYKLYAIFKKKNKLPKIYQSDALIKSATPIILEAKQNRYLLFRDNEFMLYRPTDASDQDYYGVDSNGTPIVVWTSDSTSEKFKIHYTEDNTNGDAVYGYDGAQATVPEYVTNLASYLDNVWTQIIANMGYTAPPSDDPAGGDGKFDVYLLDMNAYGYTNAESCSGSSCIVYIAIENDFAGFPENLDPEGDQKGAQKVTAAHEFFHASQFQYTTNTSSSNIWWFEATATWMEDVVYPRVKDYLNYIGRKYDDANDNGKWDSGETFYAIDGTTVAGTTGRGNGWFDLPEYSLNSTVGTYEYGTMIWAEYLSKVYGDDIIKAIWQRMVSDTTLTAISNELSSQGTTLGDAFKSFQVTNYKKDYTDGTYYPLIKHEATYTSYPQSITGTANHLASRYYAFKADETASTLSLTFNNMNSGNLAVKLVLNKVAGGYDEQDATLNSTEVTSQAANFGTSSTYSKVVLIVMNTSSSTDGETFTIEAAKSSNSSGGDDGGCFIATAAYGSYLDSHVKILRDFRDHYLLTNPAGRAFVKFYYKTSPPIADYIEKHETVRIATRWVLTPLVYGATHPEKTILLLSLAIAGLIGAFVVRRRND